MAHVKVDSALRRYQLQLIHSVGFFLPLFFLLAADISLAFGLNTAFLSSDSELCRRSGQYLRSTLVSSQELLPLDWTYHHGRH